MVCLCRSPTAGSPAARPTPAGAKVAVKQLRKELIDNMYSEDELRELADGAQIKHSRINKLPTLRQRLTERFADMLPDQDE